MSHRERMLPQSSIEVDQPRPEVEPDAETEAYQKRERQLDDAFGGLMATDLNNLLVLGESGEHGFSGDSASLFTVATAKGLDGNLHIQPYQLAMGEFSANTFTGTLPDPSAIDSVYIHDVQKTKYKRQQLEALRAFFGPLFVVPQKDGHFALRDPETFLQYMQHPIEYLQKTARLIYADHRLTIRKKFLPNGQAAPTSEPLTITAPLFEELLAHIQQSIIEKRES